jgi:D-3-phosphoglycerate dehydrogenase
LSKGPWKYEVVITDSAFADGNLEQEILSRVGANVKKYQTYDQNEVGKITKTADAILCDGAPISRTIISNLENARVIVEYGVGYDNVDVKAAHEKGITVCNVPDFMTYEVAEHTMALILSLTRRVTWADNFTKAGRWNEYGAWSWTKLMPITHLDGKTAGIVGFGRIGRQVAERLRAFRMKILAYDPYVTPNAATKVGVDLVDLPILMRQSDIISVNCLLSKETFHLIGKRELDLMKETALIVNTARGRVIDQVALVKALKSKRIAGAGLDVLEKEPCEPDDPVLSLENVIITPHVAAVSDKATLALRRLASEEVARVLRGERPKHPVTSLST